MTKILGIDPGLNKTGWGVIESRDNSLCYIACGTISTSDKQPLAGRLLALNRGLQSVLEAHNPDEAAIEETFQNKNALSSLKLGHARGVLIMTISLFGLNPREYASTKVKKSVVGVGRADKEQITAMVQMLLPKASIDGADAADALAVAICHAHHRQSENWIKNNKIGISA